MNNTIMRLKVESYYIGYHFFYIEINQKLGLILKIRTKMK